MNLRDALTQQAPSLALQRAAADEIARLDALLAAAQDRHRDAVVAAQPVRAALEAVTRSLVPPNMATPTRMLTMSEPWPQVARALWGDQP